MHDGAEARGESGDGTRRHRSRLVTLAAVTIVVGAIKVAEPLVVVVLLAAFFAAAVWPIAAWLIDRGTPRALAIALTIACVLALFGSAGLALWAIIGDLPAALSAYSGKLAAAQTELAQWLDRHGVDRLARAVEISTPIDPAALAKGVLGAANFIASLGAVLIIACFMLVEASTLAVKIPRALPASERALQHPSIETLHQVQRYLLIKTITSAATGGLLGLWTWAWSYDNPLLWGMVAFLLNFLPNVGSFIAAVPPILLAVIDMGWTYAMGVASGYLAVNVVIGNVIEPRWMGRTMGLSPLVVLLSIFFWGWLLGPFGALLSVPLTMVLKLLLQLNERSRPFAALLAPIKLRDRAGGDDEDHRAEATANREPPAGAGVRSGRDLRHRGASEAP